MERLPDWERLLAAERHAQKLVPGAVLVGGTAAAIHAGQECSMTLGGYTRRFDERYGTAQYDAMKNGFRF